MLFATLLFCSPLFTIRQINAQSNSMDTIVGTPQGNIPSGFTTNDCNGTYNLTSQSLDSTKFFPRYAPGNFGDQNCEFTRNNFAQAKNNLYNLIHQLDPGYEYIWFSVIIPQESGYDPNAWAPPVGTQAQLNGSGAWGLLQMGSSKNGNGQFDRGDVNWNTQMQNAITYNNNLNTGNYGGWCPPINSYCPSNQPVTWCYWATARNYVCRKK